MTREESRGAARLGKRSLLALARREAARAERSPTGRSSRPIDLGGGLSPGLTVLALERGQETEVGETGHGWWVHVLSGRVRARQGRVVAAGFPGDLFIGAAGCHLRAETPSVLLVLSPPRRAGGE